MHATILSSHATTLSSHATTLSYVCKHTHLSIETYVKTEVKQVVLSTSRAEKYLHKRNEGIRG